MGKGMNQADIIRIAAEEGARAGMQAYHNEREKAKKSDRRLRNVRMLLKHYRNLKSHCEEAVFDSDQMDDGVTDIVQLMSGDTTEELYVESLKRSVTRTVLILYHMEKMLGMYKVLCEKSPKVEDMRRYRVIDGLYISDTPLTATQIAEQECIDLRTVYKDKEAASDVLSVLFFGIDGLKD